MYSKFAPLFTFSIIWLQLNFTMPTLSAAEPEALISPNQLHGQVAQEKHIEQDPNFVFSPLSIAYISDMARLGAKGTSRRELESIASASSAPNSDANFNLKNTLLTHRNDADAVTLHLANRLYVDTSMLNAENPALHGFRAQLQQRFDGAAMQQASFASEAHRVESEINQFVSETTRGHIENMLTPGTIKADMRLVLVNALYFKAPWVTAFDEQTEAQTFYVRKSNHEVMEKPMTQMMRHLFTRNFGYYSSDTIQAVLLPYLNRGDNGLLYMTLVMPKDIVAFETQLLRDPSMMDDVVDRLYASMLAGADVDMELWLPKFKIAAAPSPLDLKHVLLPLGVQDIFKAGRADFSGISGDQSLYVSSFVHQAHIEVNQKGTEASAATMMGISLMSLMPQKERVKVEFNHPFVFQIRYSGFVPYGDPRSAREDLILFSGRIGDPIYD